MKFLDMYNAVAGALITLLIAIFGDYWYIFAVFIIFNMFDWVTVQVPKIKNREQCCRSPGDFKKLGYWVIIAVAFLVATVFVHMGDDVLHMDLGFLMMVGWFTVACLMVNEVRSILENLVECGCEVPAVLIKGLAVTEKLLNDEVAAEEFLNDKEETK